MDFLLPSLFECTTGDDGLHEKLPDKGQVMSPDQVQKNPLTNVPRV